MVCLRCYNFNCEVCCEANHESNSPPEETSQAEVETSDDASRLKGSVQPSAEPETAGPVQALSPQMGEPENGSKDLELTTTVPDNENKPTEAAVLPPSPSVDAQVHSSPETNRSKEDSTMANSPKRDSGMAANVAYFFGDFVPSPEKCPEVPHANNKRELSIGDTTSTTIEDTTNKEDDAVVDLDIEDGLRKVDNAVVDLDNEAGLHQKDDAVVDLDNEDNFSYNVDMNSLSDIDIQDKPMSDSEPFEQRISQGVSSSNVVDMESDGDEVNSINEEAEAMNIDDEDAVQVDDSDDMADTSTPGRRRLFQDRATKELLFGTAPLPTKLGSCYSLIAERRQFAQLEKGASSDKGSFEIMIGGINRKLSTFFYPNGNVGSPDQGRILLKDIETVHKPEYNLFRYECIAAVGIRHKNDNGQLVPKTLFNLQVLQHDKKEWNRRFVLLQILMTLCGTFRLDCLIYDRTSHSCVILPIESLKSFAPDYMYNMNAKEVTEYLNLRFAYLDRHSCIYKRDLGIPKDIHNPENIPTLRSSRKFKAMTVEKLKEKEELYTFKLGKAKSSVPAVTVPKLNLRPRVPKPIVPVIVPVVAPKPASAKATKPTQKKAKFQISDSALLEDYHTNRGRTMQPAASRQAKTNDKLARSTNGKSNSSKRLIVLLY